MDHLKEIHILDYLNGSSTDEQRAVVEGHLTSCDRCCRRYHDLKKVWDILGSWNAEALIVGREQAIVDRRPRRAFDWLKFVGRLAAAVLLAVLLGYGIGFVTRPQTNAVERRVACNHEPPDYLEFLKPGSATGLVDVLIRR